MKFRIFFLIIMSELDKDIITRLNPVQDSLPSFLIDKTFRTSTTSRMIIDNHSVCQATGKHHSPTPFFIVLILNRSVGHCRITNHKDSDRSI